LLRLGHIIEPVQTSSTFISGSCDGGESFSQPSAPSAICIPSWVLHWPCRRVATTSRSPPATSTKIGSSPRAWNSGPCGRWARPTTPRHFAGSSIRAKGRNTCCAPCSCRTSRKCMQTCRQPRTVRTFSSRARSYLRPRSCPRSRDCRGRARSWPRFPFFRCMTRRRFPFCRGP
jgi:hypothetical protein